MRRGRGGEGGRGKEAQDAGAYQSHRPRLSDPLRSSTHHAQEKTQAEVTLPPRLAEARDRAMDLAEAAGVLQAEAGLQLEPVEWAASVLRFGLAEVGAGRGASAHLGTEDGDRQELDLVPRV